jgi:glycosyltransferase involved in cell wall biosynthesis
LLQPFDLRNFSRLLRAARPDILLPYTLIPNVVCGLVWQRTGARLCVWNQRDEGIFTLNPKWQQRATQQTPQFISNSEAGARYLIEKLNIDRAKVRVIPNGIEISQPQSDRSAWRARLDIDDTAFVACMVANLHANKDHETLLKAWRLVVDALKRDAVLVLAGRHYGAYESLVELTIELELSKSVRFAGQVSDVAGLLSAVDLGVFSSRSEGCPNGVLECMAAGLAVVGTDIEAIREIVGEKFLAPPGDAARFAKIILELAGDPDLCAIIGAANQSRIKEHYNAQRMCEDTVALLSS